MCGIVGYVGERDATPILMEALTSLEYRGYDSCGIALLNKGAIVMAKAQGRLENLVRKLPLESGCTGIGHTRWATHGRANESNSHPHASDNGRFAVVHNGIIENYLEIKKFLKGRGFNFISETDSEVIAHLIEYYYAGNMLAALIKSCNRIRGSYALGIITMYEKDTLYAVKKDSPLVIGKGKNENYIASDVPALLEFTREFVAIGEGEIAVVKANKIEVYNKNKELIEKDIFFADTDGYSAQKEGYPHFMLKELYEQPAALKRTLTATFESDNIEDLIPKEVLNKLRGIQIIACGSAFHAGYAGKYLIERLCRLHVEAVVASEFIYSDPLIDSGILSLVISQSGETADTLSGLRLAKSKGSYVLAIVNAKNSSIYREADCVLLTRAGTEIAVATTKGYTTQLAVIQRLAISLAKYLDNCGEKSTANLGKTERLQDKNTENQPQLGTAVTSNTAFCQHYGVSQSIEQREKYLESLSEELEKLPDALRQHLKDVEACKQYSYSYFNKENCFFLGRNIDYALALEGALKYKEISYIHAECYPAGELKHGSISLIEKDSLVIVCATEKRLLQKILINIKEVRTRGAICIVITPYPEAFEGEAEHILSIPKGELTAPICAISSFQLFAYYVASLRGCDIDKPRNLAKSVTVE